MDDMDIETFFDARNLPNPPEYQYTHPDKIDFLLIFIFIFFFYYRIEYGHHETPELLPMILNCTK